MTRTADVHEVEMTWRRAIDLSLFIYGEGAKGNLDNCGESIKSVYGEIMRRADVADAVPGLGKALEAFRWIMATYTGNGASGVSPACWCEGGRGGLFDAERAIVAIDEALAALPTKAAEVA